jgi:alpha-beta hydrolase superfamily lysophospholipase
MPDWRAYDLSHKIKIPSRQHPGLELTLRQHGVGPPVLCVHGATFSGRIFDIPHPEVNWLENLAKAGFSAYALDIRGYGLSKPRAFPAEGAYATGQEAIADIADAVDWISQRHGGMAVSVLGWSWGTVTSARYVIAQMGRKIAALVLYAPIFAQHNQGWIDMLADPHAPACLRALTPFRLVSMADTRERWDAQLPSGAEWRRESVLTALVESSLHDDAPGASALPAAFRVPNGTFLDLWECFNGRSLYDPAAITCPTLLVRGGQDPTSTRSDALGLLDRLGAPDRSYVEIAGGTHFINAEARAPALFATVTAFLTRHSRAAPLPEI